MPLVSPWLRHPAAQHVDLQHLSSSHTPSEHQWPFHQVWLEYLLLEAGHWLVPLASP